MILLFRPVTAFRWLAELWRTFPRGVLREKCAMSRHHEGPFTPAPCQHSFTHRTAGPCGCSLSRVKAPNTGPPALVIDLRRLPISVLRGLHHMTGYGISKLPGAYCIGHPHQPVLIDYGCRVHTATPYEILKNHLIYHHHFYCYFQGPFAIFRTIQQVTQWCNYFFPV